jgi:hypothetical protein
LAPVFIQRRNVNRPDEMARLGFAYVRVGRGG